MFKSQIRLEVLRLLSVEKHSGYELMKELENLVGKKPSPGYIYPLLKDLKNKGLIRSINKENKIIYSITPEGKKVFKNLLSIRDNHIDALYNSYIPFADKEELKKARKVVNAFKQHHTIFFKEMDLLIPLKHEIAHVIDKNYDLKREEFRKVLKETLERLKRLNKK